MKDKRRWLIIDTETDGLYEPIHVVELSGQLMEGWEAVGPPFRMLLNHDVPINPAVTAIHGYTQEYLRQNGRNPEDVYESFRSYAKDYPLVSHNLSFDWNRCLEPEWARIGVYPVGQRGFCCLSLARRVITETKSYRLETLKEYFQLTQSRSHQAENDVRTVVELFEKVYRPRLESANIETFEAIAAFTRQTPVAKCRETITRKSSATGTKPLNDKDQWYFLDAMMNAHGPLPAKVIHQTAGLDAYYVWREGIQDWIVNQDCPDFIALSQNTVPIVQPPKSFHHEKSMPELIGLCRGIVADGKITTAEVMFLNSWLQDAGFLSEWPASEIAQTMERILEDGVVTKSEKEELRNLLERVTNGALPPVISEPSPATPNDRSLFVTPTETDHFHVLSIDQGTPEWLAWRHKGIGASDAPVIMGENPWKRASELLRHKRGIPREEGANAAMRRGTQLEPEARRRYALRHNLEIKPACLQSTRYDWLRASVDGLFASKKIVIEIKCGDSVYENTSLSGKPPDYYYGQLQHILAVTGYASIDFWCYLPNRPELLVTVFRDNGYIDRLLEAEYKFWRKVTGA